MSELVTFLKAFFPSNERARSNENDDYHESIATAGIRSDDSPHAAGTPPMDPQINTISKWRQERNEFLREYMESRMISPDQDGEGEENNDKEYVAPDNAKLDAPCWNDPHNSQPTGESSSAPTPSPIRRKEIPHVDETIHVAKTLSNLDLYTREFHLSLGRLEKAWDLRAIHRREWTTTSRFEDDGPLGTLFKQVLSVEVTQLLQKENHVSQAAQAAFGGAHCPERLRIFFYNKYAAQVAAFLDQEHGSQVLISFKSVPAKCIFPLTCENDPLWYDEQGLAPYCLCIGDKSSMKIEDDGRQTKVHFDGPDLQVTLARVSSDNEVAEADISATTVRSNMLEMKETPTLGPTYQEWEKARRDSEEKKDDEKVENPPEQSRVSANLVPAGSTNKGRPAESAGDNRNAKRAKAQVEYLTLNELRPLADHLHGGSFSPQVNLFGAVLGFTSPTLTKAHDWQVNVSLVDESTPLPTNDERSEDSVASTSAVIFCAERDQLPHLVKAGDVLRLHRVGVQEWKGDVQLLGRRSSSFVVVRPQRSESNAPVNDWSIIPTAKDDTIFGAEDTERAAALWHWAQARLASHPTLKPSTKMKLSDLSRQDQRESTEDTHGDLTVMVSAILSVPDGLKTATTPLGFLRVWDGTGTPTSDQLPIASAEAGAAVRNGDPPCETLQSIASVIESIKTADGDSGTGDDVASLEPPTCLCGRVVNVAVWEESHWDLVREVLRVGSFIRLRNVHESRMYNGFKCLMLSAKSGLTPVPNYTFEIKELLKDHQQRVVRKDSFNPHSGVLPLDGQTIPVAAAVAPAQDPMDIEEPSLDIMQDDTPVVDGVSSVARCISEAAPGSFEVKFRITRTISSESSSELQQGLRNLCTIGPSENEFLYQYAIEISDETGEISAVVPNDIGDIMFNMPASDACGISASEAVALMNHITRVWWKGGIRSVELDGSRYFILCSLSTV